ncbi:MULTISPECIES: SIR2 family protein [unclassified Pseudocitrobacter]|uniref:SIR2 family protein n=1 Tax=unclassified Pseudocitrobacter TaxID=2638778 RepID=UPI0023E37EC8|nr:MULTISPECIES: SIR2 family protein [unclassified Pseudocitrobacter]MDF3829786.1 SIR2 family protein [Pseudocitrobacter sp. 2023EL-00150]MEC5375509.1 SIR2 family protein [Pseudocitrobacter sp. MW920760]
MDKKISSIPDYPALEKLASSLWQQDNTYHGAAVMVGAGFSRSAATTGDARKKLPLWNDFSQVLAAELESKSSDPLHLAEEYCAYFGKLPLHDLIKRMVNDVAWCPGELHQSLLKLPWSEVLTTNWDTLLERASTELHSRVYSIVNKQSDLSGCRSPRIVKLHGTVDVTDELTFTQEDYRRYPQSSAAFVNFTRQVFIENELCLLGFSGEDPNFLQWAGWVRDNLTTHSRRIYLVGSLSLNGPKRKYLESINVTPIDLHELVAEFDDQDAKHLEATKIFLRYLEESKPVPVWEWGPTQLSPKTFNKEENPNSHDPTYGAKLLESQLTILKQDRESYPGWLVCPVYLRGEVRSQICYPVPEPRHLLLMSAENREALLYEMVWRFDKSFESLPSWMTEELLKLCDPSKPCSLSKKKQLEMALFLLKSTRRMAPDEGENVIQITSSILEKGTKFWPESHNQLIYHQALVARDAFDYSALEELAEQIEGSSTVWKMRKAALYAELGKFKQGETFIAEACRELLVQYRHNRNSLYIQSRLAWAQWLHRGAAPWSVKNDLDKVTIDYQLSGCSPWDQIENIRNRINKEREEQLRQKAIEPSFEAGYYKDNSNRVTFSNELHPLQLFEGLSTTVGIPLRWLHMSFLTEPAVKLTDLEDLAHLDYLTLAIRAASSDDCGVMNSVFSRLKIACLPQTEVETLFSRCPPAIEYWSVKLMSDSGSDRLTVLTWLRVFIEVLARVSVRATPDQAIQHFRLACSLCDKTDFRHPRLRDALRHLAEFSLESIPEDQHFNVLPDALNVPLASEFDDSNPLEWINPIIQCPGMRVKNPTIDRRIDAIIDQITPNSAKSAPALERLLPLMSRGFLTPDERLKIQNRVWNEELDLTALPVTGLYPSVLLEIPSPDPNIGNRLIRKYLFDVQGDGLFDQVRLACMVNAALNDSAKVFPEPDRASELFERMVMWQRQKQEYDILGFLQQRDDQCVRLIGKALARSVVPAIPQSDLTEANFQKLYHFGKEYDLPVVLIALPRFVYEGSVPSSTLEKILRRELQSRDSNTVAHAAYALLAWREQATPSTLENLITRFIMIVESGRIAGLQALIWTASEMYCKDFLDKESTASLIDALPVIFDNAAYENIAPSSRESVSISYVRAACIKLVKWFTEFGHLNRGDMLISEQYRCPNEKKKFQRRV